MHVTSNNRKCTRHLLPEPTQRPHLGIPQGVLELFAAPSASSELRDRSAALGMAQASHSLAASMVMLRSPPAPVYLGSSRHIYQIARQSAPSPVPAEPSASLERQSGGSSRRAGRAVCTRAAGTQAPPWSSQTTQAPPRPQQQPLERAQQLFDLLRDVGAAAAESGPAGFTRSAAFVLA